MTETTTYSFYLVSPFSEHTVSLISQDSLQAGITEFWPIEII
jgi:hypothetical protein